MGAEFNDSDANTAGDSDSLEAKPSGPLKWVRRGAYGLRAGEWAIGKFDSPDGWRYGLWHLEEFQGWSNSAADAMKKASSLK